MPDRLLIVAALAALLVVGVTVARWWAARTRGAVRARDRKELWGALGAEPDGRPTVVAFSTPSCAACRTAQTPALRRLQQTLGDAAVRVLHVDASTHVQTAKTFGVLTVPSTVVLDPAGKAVAVNYGFAPVERLLGQVQAAG